MSLKIGSKLVFKLGKRTHFKCAWMNREDFVSLKPLKAAIVNCKKNTVGGKVKWLKMHWISVNKDKPLQFQYKYSNNPLECWKTVKKTKGRPVNMGRITLPLLYDRPRAINPNKVSDLLELLDFVPPIHHPFYRCINRGTTDSGSESNSESSDED